MNLNGFILLLLLGAALWTVLVRSLIRSAIGLALTSAALAAMMFKLHAPLAAVFELSVCAGLIPVIFISAISLTQPQTQEQKSQHRRGRLMRFSFLPIIIIVIGVTMSFLKLNVAVFVPAATENDVRMILWHGRPFDVLGQIIILLVGVFGVVVLFKERFRNEP